jgi:hypothetical protein
MIVLTHRTCVQPRYRSTERRSGPCFGSHPLRMAAAKTFAAKEQGVQSLPLSPDDSLPGLDRKSADVPMEHQFLRSIS